MADTPRIQRTSESVSIYRKVNLISWRAIFAGLFIALFSYVALISLVFAVGGLAARSIFHGGLQGFSIGVGIWLGVAAVISVFLGSYFAARFSNFSTVRVGIAQGLVVCSFFFVVLLLEMGMTVGVIGTGVATTVASASPVLMNPAVQATVEDSLGDLTFRSTNAETVMTGIATRLIRGDDVAARNYLARQTGLPTATVDARITRLKNDIQTKMSDATRAAGNAIAAIGWILFGSMVLGGFFGGFGGGLGAHRNLDSSLTKRELESSPLSRAASW